MSTRHIQSRSKVYTNKAKEADCTNKEREEGDGEEEDQESEAEERGRRRQSRRRAPKRRGHPLYVLRVMERTLVIQKFVVTAMMHAH